MTTSPATIDPFCCDVSREAGEALFGTAPHITTWLLLNYSQTWHSKATEQNDLPQAVQAWFQQQLAEIPKSRLLFIRQPRPLAEPGLTFFVALSRESSPQLYRFELAEYEELLAIDMNAILSEAPAVQPYRYDDSIYLVCTNGRRDRCCAREGPALYQALANQAGPNAWQSTHLAGHRFAPNLATFPDGTFYGRLEPGLAATILQTTEQGELLLDYLRGRSCYDGVTQAAEQYLRQTRGQFSRSAFTWIETTALEGERWLVIFGDAAGLEHRLTLAREEPVEYLVSCHPAKTKVVAQYRLEEIR